MRKNARERKRGEKVLVCLRVDYGFSSSKKEKEKEERGESN
jgi:hypothetical protein